MSLSLRCTLLVLPCPALLPVFRSGPTIEASSGCSTERRSTDGRWWAGGGPGYVPQNGVLDCPAEGGGNLFTEKEYSDFVFRFEFKLWANSNNGIGMRAPLQGDAAYMGMECQVLDDSGSMYTNLLPAQYHSSLYKIAAARRGALKPVGEWNREEIQAHGRHIKVIVNGRVTVDVNLNTITDPAILAEHPGMLRARGPCRLSGTRAERGAVPQHLS